MTSEIGETQNPESKNSLPPMLSLPTDYDGKPTSLIKPPGPEDDIAKKLVAAEGSLYSQDSNAENHSADQRVTNIKSADMDAIQAELVKEQSNQATTVAQTNKDEDRQDEKDEQIKARRKQFILKRLFNWAGGSMRKFAQILHLANRK